MESKNNKHVIPMVDLQGELELIREPILRNITEIVDSGAYILGKKGEELEQELAGYVNAAFGIGVANGTDALLLALKALDIGIGDEVITTPFTFFATAEMIAQVGARPVFVDIEEESYNLNPHKLKEAITSKTKAIIVVHLFGKAANMSEIMDVAKENNLMVIEDACQAIGTEYQGRRVGAMGDIGCFSFFPSKNLGAFGDAGLIVTNHQELKDRLYKLRNHGSDKKYEHSLIGMNSRLDEIQAAILLVKFHYLDIFLHLRKEIARKYSENIHHLVKKPQIYNDREHTFHQYCIEVKNRDELSTYLLDRGISSAIYYPIPLHLQKAFHYLGYNEGDFPIAERLSTSILALPIYPTMSIEIQEKIITTVNAFIENN